MRIARMIAMGLLVATIAAPGAVTAGSILAGTPPNPNYSPVPPKEGYSYPDCFCTDTDGQRVEMGEVACLRVGSRDILARCDMSVNNPTWRKEADGCPGV